VSLALSDGDLEAVLAQYEPGAVLRPWAMGAERGQETLRAILAGVMELRLPLSAKVLAVLPVGDVALVLAEREIAGSGPDGGRLRFTGQGASVVRRQPDGSWRIAADAWCLGGP
jgi:ketosteroid isomerase-like protein